MVAEEFQKEIRRTKDTVGISGAHGAIIRP
jgi:hypothetical protein